MFSSISSMQSLINYSDSSSSVPTVIQTYDGNFTGSMTHNNAYLLTKRLSTITAVPIGTSPFTIELWFYMTQYTTGQGLFGTRYLNNSKTHGRHTCWVNYPSVPNRVTFQNGDTLAQSLTSDIFTYNKWNHLAITRDSSNTCRIFLNGVMNATMRNWTTNFADNYYAIGRAYQDDTVNQESLDLGGSITGFSISNVCYYDTNFIPTTSKLLSDPSKLLLLNFNSSVDLLTDSSSYNNTVTNLNGISYSTHHPNVSYQPLALRWDWSLSGLTNGATIFDKSGNVRNGTLQGTNYRANITTYPNTTLSKLNTFCYAKTVQGNINWYRLTSAFTLSNPSYSMSYWVYPFTADSNNNSVVWECVDGQIRHWRGANNFSNGGFGNNNSGQRNVFHSLTTASSLMIPTNNWRHIVLTHNNSNLKLNVYVNGVLTFTDVSITTSQFFSSNNVSALRVGNPIGFNENGYCGIIADFRMYNSVLPQSFIDLIYAGEV